MDDDLGEIAAASPLGLNGDLLQPEDNRHDRLIRKLSSKSGRSTKSAATNASLETVITVIK